LLNAYPNMQEHLADEDENAQASSEIAATVQAMHEEALNAHSSSHLTLSCGDSCVCDVLMRDEACHLKGTSLGCLGPQNPFRRHVARFVFESLFDSLILVLIILSSILLVLEYDPQLDHSSPLAEMLQWCNLVFTFLFTVEAALKIVAHGFVGIPGAYLRDGWNCLDFMIVLISIVSLAAPDVNTDAFKTLRTLRVLRPLRSVQRAPTLRVVVDCVMSCIPCFANIVLLLLGVYFTFAVLVVNLWAGKFWYCTDPSVANVTQCVGLFVPAKGEGYVGMTVNPIPRQWRNSPMNFDDVFTGFLTLLEVATLEGWLEPMYSAMDCSMGGTFGLQPVRNQNAYFAAYFVVFICIGNFIILNLFTTAVVDNFQKKQQQGVIVTESQRQMMNTLQMVIHTAPPFFPLPPCLHEFTVRIPITVGEIAGLVGCPVNALVVVNDLEDEKQLLYSGHYLHVPLEPDVASKIPASTGLRRKGTCGCWVTFRWHMDWFVMWDIDGEHKGKMFEASVLLFILANIAVMSMQVWQPPADMNTFIEAGSDAEDNLAKSDWNNSLEFANTIFTFIFALEAIVKMIGFGWMQYIRDSWNRFDLFVVIVSMVGFAVNLVGTDLRVNPSFFRIIRAVRAVRIMRVMRSARNAVTLLETILFSLFEIFNVACIYVLVLFIYALMGMSLFGEMPLEEGYYKAYNRHANFQSLGTGMLTLFRMSTGESWNHIMHDCIEYKGYAWLFFTSFMVLGAYTMQPLLIAIIIDHFTRVMDEDSFAIKPSDLTALNEAWSELDPLNTYFIQQHQVSQLMSCIPPPLGIRDYDGAKAQEEMKEWQREAAMQVFRRLAPEILAVNALKHFAELVTRWRTAMKAYYAEIGIMGGGFRYNIVSCGVPSGRPDRQDGGRPDLDVKSPPVPLLASPFAPHHPAGATKPRGFCGF